MIPKTIHYCWFGGKELPELAQKCIDSWRQFCPDYQIIEWNEHNFNVEENRYTREAYQSKKYAFVTDYVRLKVLYEHGGIYMDTDVEVIKSLEHFLVESAFSGFESPDSIPTGIMGAQMGNRWIGYLLSYYDEAVFIKENGELELKTNVETISSMTAERYGIELNNKFIKIDGELSIYPKDFFCPYDLVDGKIKITENTYTIHHFAGSWIDEVVLNSIKRNQRLNRLFGMNLGSKINAVIYNYEVGGIKGVLRKIDKRNRNY